MAASGASVLTNFIINLCICIGCLLVFSYLRVSAFCRRFYAPRRYAKDILLKPMRLPNMAFGWIPPLLVYKEEDIIDEVGLDGAIYLRVVRFGLFLFAIISVGCVLLLIPTNLTSDEVDRLMSLNANRPSNEQYTFTSFDKLSLSNIPRSSKKMGIHVLAIYFVCCTTMALLWKFSKEAVLLRLMFLANSPRGGPSHTVLVTDIPGVAAIRSENAAALKEMQKEEAKAKKKATKEGKQNGTLSERSSGQISSRPSATGATPSETGDTVAPDAVPYQAMTDDDDPESLKPRKKALSLPPRKSADPLKALPPAHKCPEGLSPEEIELELQEEHMKGIADQAMLRKTKRFHYDLSDTRLDPTVQIRRKFAAGMEPQEVVKQEFELVYSAKNVAAVNMVMNQSVLGPLVAEYDAIQNDLEDFLSLAEHRLRLKREIELPQKLIVNPKGLGEWGTSRYGTKWFQKVDALRFWTERMQFLRDRIIEEQEKARYLMAPAAFVTFNTRTAQCTAAGSLHHHDELAWRVQDAPSPQEVQWGAVAIPFPVKSSSRTLMWAAFWAMTLFFMIPVGALQALIDIPNLAKTPGLKDFVNAPVIKQLLQAIVPGLVLKIFLALVPLILTIMMKASGANSDSEIDFGVVTRFFLFQIVVVFFGTMIAGSFFSQLQRWIKDPTSVFTILGTAIPQVSTFFITYTLILGLGTQCIQFLRVVGLILFWLFSKIAGSPRKRERIWSQQYTTYGTTVVQHTMVILFGITYSCINPIITLTCLAYFIVSNVTERYQTIYVFRRTYESGGKLWKVVFQQVMIALYIMEIAMLGLLSIKAFKASPIIIPLIIGTIMFHISTTTLFNRPWTLTSLHDAAELDQLEAEEKRRLINKARKLEHARSKTSLTGATSEALLNGAPSLAGPQASGATTVVTVDPDEPPEIKPGEVIPLSEQEKAEIAEMYLSPVFKVELEDVDRLTKTSMAIRDRIVVDMDFRLTLRALKGDAKAIAMKKQKEEEAAAKAALKAAELDSLEAEEMGAAAVPVKEDEVV